MKITIVQREIEEAIRQYVHTQINVKEGHEITMDFTATRGDDGLVAAIDISPVVAPTKGPKAAARQVSVRETPAPRVSPAQPAPASTSVTAQEDETAPAPAPSVFARAAAEGTNDAEVVNNDAVSNAVVPDEPETVPGERPLGKSIFSNITRPSSQEAAA